MQKEDIFKLSAMPFYLFIEERVLGFHLSPGSVHSEFFAEQTSTREIFGLHLVETMFCKLLPFANYLVLSFW